MSAGSEASVAPRAPWWTRSRIRLPILLAILAGLTVYAVPRLTAPGAVAGPVREWCAAGADHEPRGRALDEYYLVEDGFQPGFYARAAPCGAGSFVTRASRWYRNGAVVDVDCARLADSYSVEFRNGWHGTWRTWLHIRGGEWLMSVIADARPRNGFTALPSC